MVKVEVKARTNKRLYCIADKKCPCNNSEKALWLPQAGQNRPVNV